MSEFKVGDIVSVQATVGESGYSDLISITVTGDPRPLFLSPDRLTLIERPQREVTVTLTEDEARALRDWCWAEESLSGYRKLDSAIEALGSGD
jgi:hypothetical protein